MPKYSFECSNCGNTTQLYCHMDKVITCHVCDENMQLLLPTITSEVRETVNKETNAHWKQDQKEILAERKANYFWEVEVPRLVNSGVYTLETMLENGWVYYDEKNNLQTRTSPPQKQ